MATRPSSGENGRSLSDLAPHLHQQIVLPLMAACLVFAIVATAVGVTYMSRITNQWVDEDMKQTMTTVVARFDDVRRHQASDAAFLAEDQRLRGAVDAGGAIDTAEVTKYLVAVRQAVPHDNLMLLDAEGIVVASTGQLGVKPGSSVLDPEVSKWTGLAMELTTFLDIDGTETLTSFGRYDAGGHYVLAVSDVLDAGFLQESLRGLGAGFAYFDADGRLITQFVDETAVGGGEAAGELAKRLSAEDAAVKDALKAPGTTFSDLSVAGAPFRMLAQTIRFDADEDPTEGRGQILAVVSTEVAEQAGQTTMRLIAFWSVLAVVALTAFGLLVARRVSRPLVDLSGVVRRIAEGDFSQRVAIGGSNEIADLAHSFNQMTDSLKQRTESITKKVLELATLYEMSRALGSTLELDVLLDSVLDSALRIFNVESGYIVLRDRDTEQLQLKAWRGMAGGRPDERALRSSMCEWVAREGRPLIYNPPNEGDAGKGQVDNITGATAALCVPLISNEGIIGAATVGSRDPDFRFTSDDVRLLSTIANHATIAVGNIELFSTLQEAYIATVRALAAAVDAKDPYTRGHSDRVATYSMAIAEKLDLSVEQRTALEMAAYLHDIGKIGIREEILLKPGKLDDIEMSQMRHHPLIGANILKPVAFPWAIAPVVRHHHEHWDGRGYPAGLRGEEVPLLARILSVADSYEAMTSDRPYRRGRSAEEGIAELKRCAGTQFDPRVVESFVAVLKAMEREREAMGAHVAEDVHTDEARAIFVAVCDGMLASFRRLGGPRLSSNLETELNRFFASEQLPFTFSGGRLSARWDGEVDREAEIADMRRVLGVVGDGMARTSGASLVDGFYTEALGSLSNRMRLLAEAIGLYVKA